MTWSELAECRYSRGNSKLYKRPSLVQRNPFVDTGPYSALPTCARTLGAACLVPRLDLRLLCPGPRCWAKLPGLPGLTGLAHSSLVVPVHPLFQISPVVLSDPHPAHLNSSLLSGLHSPPPGPAIPRLFDLVLQPRRPERRSHTGTLKLTPRTPGPKQSQAHGPLFHVLGHSPCPFPHPIRPGLLPRSTFLSPRRPGPPPLISSSSQFGADSLFSSSRPSSLLVLFPQWVCVRLLLVCSCLSALPGSFSFLRSPGLFLGLPTPWPASIHLPPLPRFSAPLLSPPALARALCWLLLARRAARLGRPPARPPLCTGVWWNLC